MSQLLRIGTRGSKLALWQSNWVKAELESLGCKVSLVTIKTEGDTQTGPLAQIGGQGLFTKRLQQALLDDKIDIAVHSMKDLPTNPHPGLVIPSIPKREDPRDVLVGKSISALNNLTKGSVIGTGSVRRATQLRNLREDLDIRDIRGNVDTRLRKLDDGEFDAIVLAAAGLKRLGWEDRISYYFDSKNEIVPAVGQGALAIETREDNTSVIETVSRLKHEQTFNCVMAERSMLFTLKAGCLAPVGAWTKLVNDQLTLQGVVISRDGKRKLVAKVTKPMKLSVSIGEAVAKELLEQGAGKILHE